MLWIKQERKTWNIQGLSASYIINYFKNKEMISRNFADLQENRKKMKSGNYHEVEKCLMKWILVLGQNIPLKGNILRDERLKILENSWDSLTLREAVAGLRIF